jgi:hypothetical protein
MNTFNKKSLYVAIAAIGAVGAGGAQAVNIATDGLGEVLIYPYYTVNNDSAGHPYNTLLSVVNTTATTKAVKMRFREGKNSREVLDFNIFLSPFDVWTAAVTPNNPPAVSGTTPPAGAQISTSDNTCTIPNVQAASPVAFRNLAYIGDTAAAGFDSISRTAEGYVEVFEMATYSLASITGLNSKHDSTGVPKDCSKVTDATASLEAQPVQGGLFGGLTIVNPFGGGAFSQPATPLANFHVPGFFRYDPTGVINQPSYTDASPISALVSAGTFYRSTWAGGLQVTPGTQAVTATLMANSVYNEYVLDTGTKSGTEWVLTSPTKYAHTDHAAPADAPYTKVWDTKVGGACEAFFAVVFNREEGAPQVVNNADFSPQPGPAPGVSQCWESNIVAFYTTGTTPQNVLGSANLYTLQTPYTNGWAVISYNDPSVPLAPVHSVVNNGATISTVLSTGAAGPTTATYFGLPVIGFAAETFQNTALTINGVTYLSTFGAEYAHRLQTKVQ